jgi:multiple sugar transport system permease protein
MARNKMWTLIVTIAVMAVLLVWTLFPFYWMLVTSIKENSEIYSPVVQLIPRTFTLKHWGDLITKTRYLQQFQNSLIIATTTTLISMSIGSLCAYAVVRLRYQGRTLSARLLIMSYLVPPSLLFIPLFQLMIALGLISKIYGTVLAHLTFTVPFCTWLLVGYFKTVPAELEEAAKVDGTSIFGTLWRITLPLSAPALVVTALFSFTQSWNEFLYALVLNPDRNVRPITAGLVDLIAVEDVFFWGRMMAAAVLGSIPPIILYSVAQRWVVQGLTLGAVKG